MAFTSFSYSWVTWPTRAVGGERAVCPGLPEEKSKVFIPALFLLSTELEFLVAVGGSRHTESFGSGAVVEAVYQHLGDAATIRVDLVQLVQKLLQQDGVHDDPFRISAGCSGLQLVVVVEIVDGAVVTGHLEAADAAVAFAELPTAEGTLPVTSGKVVTAPDRSVPLEVDLFGDGNGLAVQIDESICVCRHEKSTSDSISETEVPDAEQDHTEEEALSIGRFRFDWQLHLRWPSCGLIKL